MNFRVPWFRWVFPIVLAEAFAIAVVALAYGFASRTEGAQAACWILGAGAMEGLLLGSVQAVALRPFGSRPLRWVTLTIAGAILGYALSLPGSLTAESGREAFDPGLGLTAVMGAGIGLCMGALLGACQIPALPRWVHPSRWILANVAGWTIGMALIMVVASSIGEGASLRTIAMRGALAGAGAGLFVGVATGLTLSRVMDQPSSPKKQNSHSAGQYPPSTS